MLVEELDQLGEVGERAGQPVDLVDDDDVDPSRANGVQQLLAERASPSIRRRSRRRRSGPASASSLRGPGS